MARSVVNMTSRQEMKVGSLAAPLKQVFVHYSRSEAAVFGLIVAICCAVSVSATGNAFGVGNNVFHIPIVLGLSSDPMFRDDAFYASLSRFTSVVWPIVKVFTTEENVRDVFASLQYASRGLAFVAIALFLLRGLELSRFATVIALFALAGTPWLIGLSPVGGHGLFVHYFTHSELTWGFLLFAWLALFKHRYIAAASLLGLVFSINGFIGVWSVVAALVATLARGERGPPLRTVLQSALVFLLFAAPAAIWIAGAVTGEPPAGFSFLEYIRLFYPDHFLIEAATPTEVLRLALVVAAGAAAAFVLPGRRFWLGLLAGYALVVLVGIPLPYVIDSRFVFNLVLLRADGVAYFLSMVLLIAAFARIGASQDGRHRSLLAIIALMLLTAPNGRQIEVALIVLPFVLAASLALAFVRGERKVENRSTPVSSTLAWVLVLGALVSYWTLALAMRSNRGFLWAFGMTVVVFAFVVMGSASRALITSTAVIAFSLLSGLITASWQRHHEKETARERVGWNDVTEWIRHSPLTGTFLVELNAPADSFQLLARRPVWVDWRQGAAAMWQPSFGPRWMTRYQEVKSLSSDAAMLRYAEEHRIDNVVLTGSDGSCTGIWRTAYARGKYVVCVRS